MEKGVRGVKGDKGVRGVKGDKGVKGIKGVKGDKVLSQFVLGTNFRTREGRGFEGEGEWDGI